MSISLVGVIGAGFMGSGIAQSVAGAGKDVLVYEPTQPPLERSRASLAAALASAVARERLEAPAAAAIEGRVRYTTVFEELNAVDAAIEAVSEDRGLKREVFARLDAIAADARFLGSNTSSIPIGELAAATARPERVIGLHFFSPVPVMKLVEVVGALETAPAALAAADAFAVEIGKQAIRARDRAGFVVNALLVPYLIAAIRMYEQGFASREDIDLGMTLGCGHPMGPLTLCDFIGLDVLDAVCRSLYEEFREQSYAPPPLLSRMVAAGQLGRKSGRGFYEHPTAGSGPRVIVAGDTLAPELVELHALVRRLARERIVGRAGEIDRSASYPQDIRKLLAENDVFGLPFAERYGGLGTGTLMLQMAVEEIAWADASCALMLMLQELGTLPIALFGSEKMRTRVFPRCASGEWLAAFALSEAEAGSDAAAMRTWARRDGEEWVLNGAKAWISNAGVADFYVVFAVTDRDAGRITAFLVEADRPGLTIAGLEHKLGIRGSPTGSPTFEDVRVPAANVIGEVGRGMRVALATLERSRLGAAAQAVGIAQGALDYAVRYAKERIAFGSPIFELQAIQLKLADMQTGTAAARELLHSACRLADRDPPPADLGMWTSMAKLFASDNAMRVTVEAVQVLGGAGYVNDHPLERMMRDAKITQIYEGTNEIQRVVIARHLAAAADQPASS